MVELVHGLLEAPLGISPDVSATAAAAGGHRGSAWRGGSVEMATAMREPLERDRKSVV